MQNMPLGLIKSHSALPLSGSPRGSTVRLPIALIGLITFIFVPHKSVLLKVAYAMTIGQIAWAIRSQWS